MSVVTGGGGAPATITGIKVALPRPVPEFTGTDYTPAGWPGTSIGTIAADLARARDLGLDAVRLRIPFASLAGPAGLAALPGLLAAAQQAGISVVPVLFDGVADLSPASWAAADHDLAAVVAALAGSPAVVLWDIADRPDLRIDVASPTEITAFLAHQIRLLRSLSPTVPLTISWSDPAAAADPEMVGQVDLVSLSWTGSPVDLPGAIGQLQGSADGRPVMVAATTSATDGGWSPFPRSERRQAVEVSSTLIAAQRADITRTVVDRLQDTTTDQHGLLRADSVSKPAAALVRPGAPLTTVAGPGIEDYLAANFWRTAAVLVVVGVFFVVRHRLRAGRRLRSRTVAAGGS